MCCGTLYVFYIGTSLKVVMVHMQPHKLGPAIYSYLWSQRTWVFICICGIPGTQSENGSLQQLVQGRVRVLLYGFCSSIHCSRRGNIRCTITHCQKRLVYEAHILSEACYFNYSYNKRQQPTASLGRGQGTVMGVEKKVYTLLICMLVLVLSLSSLSRASIPGIASIAMNSILPTTTTDLWLVISAREP